MITPTMISEQPQVAPLLLQPGLGIRVAAAGDVRGGEAPGPGGGVALASRTRSGSGGDRRALVGRRHRAVAHRTAARAPGRRRCVIRGRREAAPRPRAATTSTPAGPEAGRHRRGSRASLRSRRAPCAGREAARRSSARLARSAPAPRTRSRPDRARSASSSARIRSALVGEVVVSHGRDRRQHPAGAVPGDERDAALLLAAQPHRRAARRQRRRRVRRPGERIERVGRGRRRARAWRRRRTAP